MFPDLIDAACEIALYLEDWSDLLDLWDAACDIASFLTLGSITLL
jgi:hypothetical protein